MTVRASRRYRIFIHLAAAGVCAVMVQLHLLDTKLGLVVVYCSFVTPFVLWIMANYFQSLPRELEDAARVDGCTRMGALFRVVLPLSRPGLIATALFGFLLAWDEF